MLSPGLLTDGKILKVNEAFLVSRFLLIKIFGTLEARSDKCSVFTVSFLGEFSGSVIPIKDDFVQYLKGRIT